MRITDAVHGKIHSEQTISRQAFELLPPGLIAGFKARSNTPLLPFAGAVNRGRM
jgi:hypothetical protein